MSWTINIEETMPADCEINSSDGLPVNDADLVLYDNSLEAYAEAVRNHVEIPRKVKRVALDTIASLRERIYAKQLAQGLSPANLVEPVSTMRIAHLINASMGSGLLTVRRLRLALTGLRVLVADPVEPEEGEDPPLPLTDEQRDEAISDVMVLIRRALTELRTGADWAVSSRVVRN